MGGDFNAHIGTLSDEDVFGDLPSEADFKSVLSAAGYLVSGNNNGRTPGRRSYGKKLVEVCKNDNVVIFGVRTDDMGIHYHLYYNCGLSNRYVQYCMLGN